MSDMKALPGYSDEELADLNVFALIDLIIADCDRIPLNVITECVRRGDEMTAHLEILHVDEFLWDLNADEGVWWLKLHAAMILGQIPGEQAGLLLLELMKRLSQEDDDMQDWLAGYWPALFKNKPQSVLPELIEFCEDKNRDWYMRSNAMEVVVANAAWQGGEALETTLAWLARIAGDEEEDWEICLEAGSLLLYFPRLQYRQLLEELAALQAGFDLRFDMQSVKRAYDGVYFEPEWERFSNPLEFYEQDAITKRQIRRLDEDAEVDASDEDILGPDENYDFGYTSSLHEPYVRLEPKVGRNDPCPCGSGKKYKKCCLTGVSMFSTAA